ncbi:EXS family-domain-containing protein [Hyaloraphidium curvatum]|nr:EXS family-domain-containing protein [Hyaloraphidium curvatum]
MAFWPFDHLYRSARFWVLRSLLRICTLSKLGTLSVPFCDTFVASALTSATYSFTAMQAFVCAYASGWNGMATNCAMGASYYVALPTCLPPLFRMSQCLLKFWDKGQRKDLVNAARFAFSVTVVWFAAWSAISGLPEAHILWIVVAAVSAAYSYCWDIYMSFSLLRIRDPKDPHFLLRPELRYSPQAVYYFAMVSNLLLRVSWIVTVSPSYWGILVDGRMLALVFALLEVARRFQWNLLVARRRHLKRVSATYRCHPQLPDRNRARGEQRVQPGRAGRSAAVPHPGSHGRRPLGNGNGHGDRGSRGRVGFCDAAGAWDRDQHRGIRV